MKSIKEQLVLVYCLADDCLKSQANRKASNRRKNRAFPVREVLPLPKVSSLRGVPKFRRFFGLARPRKKREVFRFRVRMKRNAFVPRVGTADAR